MSTNDKYLIIAGVIICLVIAVMSPFIASSNPDGLEKTAESLAPNPEPDAALQSVMPDYSIEGLGKTGEIAALIVGVLVTLLIAFAVAMLFSRRQPPEISK